LKIGSISFLLFRQDEEPIDSSADSKPGKLRPSRSNENLNIERKNAYQLRLAESGAVPRSSSFRTADGRDSAHTRRTDDVPVFGCSVLERIRRFESEL
jgi:hypothetical protein